MAGTINAPRGTQDALPAQVYKWHYVEAACRRVAADCGFSEIRPPVFEHTELFSRGVGDTTDIVQKEMYTFEDKGGRSITLRPEFTAGVVRAVLQNGLYSGPLPVSVYYLGSCFRYEKPQSGRFREFHQFGAEMFGPEGPQADAQLIALAHTLITRLGITGLSVHINSIGCRDCRPAYHDALREYFRAHMDRLCPTCHGRLERNPLRILDCKSPECAAVAKGAPRSIDHLCGDCAAHFAGLRDELDICGIAYEIDTDIVRGLDYYTRSVFEIISSDLGAQNTICGGGRYDYLVEELGGAPMPAAGFAMGLERLISVMETNGLFPEPPPSCALYIAAIGERAEKWASGQVYALRAIGVAAQRDLCGRSVKAQMKYADKIGALYTVVVGDDELASGHATVKDMSSGKTAETRLDALIELMTNSRIDARR